MDRIRFLFFAAPSKLEKLLNEFKDEARPIPEDTRVDHLLRKLQETADSHRRLNSARRRDERGKAPIPAPNFAKHDTQTVSEEIAEGIVDTEPEDREEDEFETPPQSPSQHAVDSANRRRERQERRGCGGQLPQSEGGATLGRTFLKRPSDNQVETCEGLHLNWKFTRTSNGRQASTSTNSEYFSVPSEAREETDSAPNLSQLSYETALTQSFGSTISATATARGGQTTANTSFGSDFGLIPSHAQSRSGSDNFAVPSLSSDTQDHLQQMLRKYDFRRAGDNLPSSESMSWDPEMKDEAIRIVKQYESTAPQTPSEPTRDLHLDPSKSGEEQRSVPFAGFTPEHHQVRDMPTKGFFVEEEPRSPRRLPFRMRWETARISLTNSLPANQLTTDPSVTIEDYDAVWQCFIDLSGTLNIKLPRKGPSKAWAAATGAFEGVILGAKLSFNTESNGPLFSLSLNPLELDKSCRFERAFGGDRFLYVLTPTSRRLPNHLRGQQENLRKRLIEWLLAEKEFLGRKWRAIHIEAYKSQKRDENHFDLRIIFFATEGYDILPKIMTSMSGSFNDYSSSPETSVEELLNWFMPLEKNKDRPYCKLFSRIRLGFSRTIPTVIFRPDRIQWIRDVLADGIPEATQFDDPDPALDWSSSRYPTTPTKPMVMNDGCARISLGACRLIWEKLGANGAIPSVFQARINGAKGVWIRSAPTDSTISFHNDIWIEINDSQKKFDPHDEDTPQSFNIHRWTFEVIRFSHSLSPTALHLAFVPILFDRGVKLDEMQRLVTKALDDEKKDLLIAVTNPLHMRSWINQRFSNSEERRRTDGLRWQASLPMTLAEKIVLCLEAGFEPLKLPYLGYAIEKIAQVYFSRVMESLSVRVGRSAMALGIADPMGILEPGQVHFAFSENFVDDASGDSMPFLKSMEVLVARHPALRASDIQKVQAVYKPELSHLVDVIVFPSRGCVPLASKLQGGDYDGDVFWVCWEPALVQGFKNAPAPLNIPKPETYGIDVDGRTLNEIVIVGERRSIDNFLASSFAFACNPSFLGVATNFHEKLAYAANSISDPGVNLLADLHSYLIDASKNGYNFNQASYENFIQRNQTIRCKQPQPPAYKVAMEMGFKQLGANSRSPTKELPERPKNINDANVIDHLFFKIIEPHLLRTIENLKQRIVEANPWDSDLQNLYMDEHSNGDEQIRAELQSLKRELRSIRNYWNKNVTGGNVDDSFDPDAYNNVLEECYKRLTTLKPTNLDHPIIARWTQERLGEGPTKWTLIKASALFLLFHTKHNFTFNLAGRELAYIKAHYRAGSRILVEPLWAQLKPRKFQTQEEDQELSQAPQSSAGRLRGSQTLFMGHSYVAEESTAETESDYDDFYSTIGDFGTYEME